MNIFYHDRSKVIFAPIFYYFSENNVTFIDFTVIYDIIYDEILHCKLRKEWVDDR